MYESSQLEELIQEKFFYAGHCARWMLAEGLESVKNELDRHLGACTNPEKILKQEVSDSSQVACNSLSTRLGLDGAIKKTLVSEFVIEELFKRTDESGIKWLRVYAHKFKIAAIDGYALEFEVMSMLRKCQDAARPLELLERIEGKDASKAARAVKRVVPIASSADIPNGTTLEDGCWLRSQKSNQGCFDIVRVDKLGDDGKGKLVVGLDVVQITRAEKHVFTGKFIDELIKQLYAKSNVSLVEKVQLSALVASDAMSTYSVDPVRDVRKSQALTGRGWDGQIHVFGFQRAPFESLCERHHRVAVVAHCLCVSLRRPGMAD